MTVVLALLDWHWQVWAGGIDNGDDVGLVVRYGTACMYMTLRVRI